MRHAIFSVVGLATLVALMSGDAELAAYACPLDASGAVALHPVRATPEPYAARVRDLAINGRQYALDGYVMRHMHWAEVPVIPFQPRQVSAIVTIASRERGAVEAITTACVSLSQSGQIWTRRAFPSAISMRGDGVWYRSVGAGRGPEWTEGSFASLELLLSQGSKGYRLDLGEVQITGAD